MPLDIERLASIERNWQAEFMETRDLIDFFAVEVRDLWRERDALKSAAAAAQQEDKDAVVPLDGVERNALKSEIEEKRVKLVDAYKDIESLKEKINEYDLQKKDLQGKLELTEEDKLEMYLTLLEKKFKDKYDAAMALRAEGKLNEYAITAVTLAYHLVYSAKVGWASACRAAKELSDEVIVYKA